MVDTQGSIDPNYNLPVSEAPIIDRKIPQSAFEFDQQFEAGVISTAKIKNITADKISAGTIVVALNLGAGNITLDGANKRIIVNDGTNDRVLIGYQSGGF